MCPQSALDLNTRHLSPTQPLRGGLCLYADYYDEFLNPDGTVNDSLFLDGLHPNPAGYALMWKVVAPLINEELQ
jgi:hypothetical protein